MNKRMLLGILGDSRVDKSLSPGMHKAALAYCGLTGDYVRLPVKKNDIMETMAGLWSAGYHGINVTIPYKQLLIPYLEAVCGQAKIVGAVNTLVRGASGFIGHNTDINGCCQTIKNITTRHSVALVGTGGVARAMLAALGQKKAHKVWLLGRDAEKTKALARQFKVDWISPLPGGFVADWFINATSVSVEAEGVDLHNWAQSLRPRIGVLDLNYGRKENLWAGLAGRHNVIFQDGLVMLAWQAKYSFRLWSGQDVPIRIFQETL